MSTSKKLKFTPSHLDDAATWMVGLVDRNADKSNVGVELVFDRTTIHPNFFTQEEMKKLLAIAQAQNEPKECLQYIKTLIA